MSVYIINVILIMLIGYFFNKFHIKKSYIPILISFQLFLLSAVRAFQVGTDVNTYVKRFTIIASASWKDFGSLGGQVDFEVGYILFNKLIGMIYNNERFFLFLVSALIMYGVYKFIIKSSKLQWYSLFLYVTLGFWSASMNLIRQYLAMIILLYSLKFIREKSIVKFLLVVLCATTFHISALFWVIMYPLSYVKITKKFILILGVTGSIIFLNIGNLLKIASNLGVYRKYFENLGSDKGSGNGMLLLLAVCIVGCLLIKFVYKVKEELDIYIHMLLVAIVLNMMALEISMVGRLMLYFQIGMVVALPNAISYINDRLIRIIALVSITLFSLYYYIQILLAGNINGVVPYVFGM